MAVLAFLYYVSQCEKESYVGQKLYKNIKDFSCEIAALLRDYLLHSESQSILINNLGTENISMDESNEQKKDDIEVGFCDCKGHELNRILGGFDFRIRENGFNKLIMPSAIDDFCMFSVLLLSLYGKADLDWIGDASHPINEYLSYIRICKKSKTDDYSELDTKDRIRKYLYFINADSLKNSSKESEERDKIENDTSKILELLANTIKSRFKSNCKEEAREKQAKYLRNYKIIETNKAQWVLDISNELKKRFGTCLEFDSKEDLRYRKNTLFSFTTYTDMINSKISKTDKSEIVNHLIDCYISELAKTGSIVLKDRKVDFDDDQIYINYIRDNKLDLFLGSEYLLSNSDYRKSEAFREATENATWIKTIGSLYGAAIKKGSVIFYIRKINVSVRDATPKDVGYMYTKDSGVYEVIDGVNIPFDTDEFSDYIGKERKIIEISAEIAVKTYKKDIGIYFINKGSL